MGFGQRFVPPAGPIRKDGALTFQARGVSKDLAATSPGTAITVGAHTDTSVAGPGVSITTGVHTDRGVQVGVTVEVA